MNAKKKTPERKSSTRVEVPVVHIPQPDGSILYKPGKPRVPPEEIGTREFARRTGLSQRHVLTLCEQGLITSRPLSAKQKSKRLIPITEVDRYRNLE